MKCLSHRVLPIVLAITTLTATAQDGADPDIYPQQISNNTQTLANYLLHLGGYLGYDLTQPATAGSTTVSQELLNLAGIQLIQNYLFNTTLGAIPVAAAAGGMIQFVPNNFPVYNLINSFGNYTFKTPAYSTPASQQNGTVSVNPLIDQKTYQPDPVSQGVLNILATPDYSYCMKYDGSAWNSDCDLLYQYLVMSNTIGTLPDTYTFFSYDYNQKFISQLNSNSLLAPLLYSTSSDSQSTSSTQPSQNGLSAQSQAQQAANFIRYAAAFVTPMTLPKLKDYDRLYTKASNTDKSVSQADQMQAHGQLASYLASLRVYAAQSSVGISNLYYMLSRRMPQNQSASGSNPSSQALSEFTMASWRLFNPDQTPNKQWLNQINQASSATVQKEIATLLAEINYQLYLSRQQEERLLLTNTMLLMQYSRVAQPNASALSPSAPQQQQ